MKKIYISKPFLDDKDKSSLIKTFDSSWISSVGEKINIFEDNFAKYTGSKYSLTCSNGTQAIELSLRALNIKNNDEVIVPNLTFAATINAVINVGAKPVILDCNNKNFSFNKKELKKAIGPKTFAIIFVHLMGIPINITNDLKGIKKNFYIIEDCAESLGSKINSIHTGNFSDCATFSFFSNKIITTGEGGMINFKKKSTFNVAKKIKNQGRSLKKYYWHDHFGGNYRMTNLQASLGITQLSKINRMIKMRRKIYKIYDEKLQKYNFINPLHKKIECNFNEISYWYYTIFIDNYDLKKRDKLIKELGKKGIETRPLFYPLSDMKIYSPYLFKEDTNSRYLSYSSLSLPTYPDLKKEEISHIIKTLVNLI